MWKKRNLQYMYLHVLDSYHMTQCFWCVCVYFIMLSYMYHYVTLYDDIYVYTNCMLRLRVSKHVLWHVDICWPWDADWWSCTCFILSDKWHIRVGRTGGRTGPLNPSAACLIACCIRAWQWHLVHIEIYWNISKQDNEPERTSASEFRHLKHLGFHGFSLSHWKWVLGPSDEPTFYFQYLSFGV